MSDNEPENSVSNSKDSGSESEDPVSRSEDSVSESEPSPEFSCSAVKEWVELMRHPKTRSTVVSCLVYISNAIKAEQLNPLRVKISLSNDENSERDSSEKVGEIELTESTRVDVFSEEEWPFTIDEIDHLFVSFVRGFSSQKYVRDPCSRLRRITRGLKSKLFQKPVWSGVERDVASENSINKLRTFLASGGGNAKRKPAQMLLNAIVSIGQGFHIEEASPLHEAVKWKDLDAVIMLLSHGVNVNAIDEDGFTALHYSVQVDCPIIAKALILFGAEPIVRRIVANSDESEEDGEESEYESDYEVEVEEEDEEEESEEEDDLDDEEEEYDEEEDEEEDEDDEEEETDEEGEDELEDEEQGVDVDVEDEVTVETLTLEHARSEEMKEVIKIFITPLKLLRFEDDDTVKSEDGAKTHLLSLDGGGIRGLVLTTILTELDRVIPGIVDRCEWTAGTSTGSILALALAHGKSIDECRNMYFNFKDVVFTPSKHGYINNDVTILEEFLQKTFKNDEGGLTTLEELGEMSGKKLISTTVDKSGGTFVTRLFKSYKMPDSTDKGRETPDSETDCKLHDQDPSEIPVWEVARCTGQVIYIYYYMHLTSVGTTASSAAPFYFESHKGYSDGGLTNNNPTPLLLNEWGLYNTELEKISKRSGENDDEGEKPKQLGAVISIGTGKLIEVKNKEVERPMSRTEGFMTFLGYGWTFRTFLKAFESTVKIGHQFFKQIGKSDGDIRGTFFRFTPDVEEETSLDETNNETLIEMMWTAKVYMRKQVKHIHRLKKALDNE